MKLLTRLRELRTHHTDFLIYDYSDNNRHVDAETIGVGATTSSDIDRLNLESHIFKKLKSSQK